jgi:hypothetical protein
MYVDRTSYGMVSLDGATGGVSLSERTAVASQSSLILTRRGVVPIPRATVLSSWPCVILVRDHCSLALRLSFLPDSSFIGVCRVAAAKVCLFSNLRLVSRVTHSLFLFRQSHFALRTHKWLMLQRIGKTLKRPTSFESTNHAVSCELTFLRRKPARD